MCWFSYEKEQKIPMDQYIFVPLILEGTNCLINIITLESLSKVIESDLVKHFLILCSFTFTNKQVTQNNQYS